MRQTGSNARMHHYGSTQQAAQVYSVSTPQTSDGGTPSSHLAHLYQQMPQTTPPRRRNKAQLRQKAQLLKQELAQMKYKAHVSSEKVFQGNASVYLPAIHFLLLIYSEKVADYIRENGYTNLVAQNDYAFMMNVLGVLDRIFDLKPPFKIEEFFAPNTAIDRKLSFMLQLVEVVKTKEQQLSKRHSETSSAAGTEKGSGKQKSVTFRQEDSIAMPNPAPTGGRVSNLDQATAEQQKGEAQSQYEAGVYGTRVSNHQRASGSVEQKTPQGILVNNHTHQQSAQIEHKRISVPKTSITSSEQKRPSTAGPAPETRSGILVQKNVQRAPSANSEQSRHSGRLNDQRSQLHGSQHRQERDNSAVNNYYQQNPHQMAQSQQSQNQGVQLSSQQNYMSRHAGTKVITLRKDQSPSVQSNASSQNRYSGGTPTQQPTILQQQKYLARVNNNPTSTTSKTGASTSSATHQQEDQNSLTLGQVQNSSQSLNSNQVEKLIQQNNEFSQVIKNLHKTVKTLSLQMETIQSGYEKRFVTLTTQNQALESRLTQQEAQMKKYKAKLKALSHENGGGHGARGNSYNRANPHANSNTAGERIASNQRARQSLQRQESSGEKQVLAAHQITFNQHIVMENRSKPDFTVPMSEDGHQSITSVTFHQRENNHLALPITKISGTNSQHAHILSSHERNSEAKMQQMSGTKRPESHDALSSQMQNDNASIQAPYATHIQKEQQKPSMALHGQYSNSTNKLASLPASTKHSHNYGNLGHQQQQRIAGHQQLGSNFLANQQQRQQQSVYGASGPKTIAGHATMKHTASSGALNPSNHQVNYQQH